MLMSSAAESPDLPTCKVRKSAPSLAECARLACAKKVRGTVEHVSAKFRIVDEATAGTSDSRERLPISDFSHINEGDDKHVESSESTSQ
jgi:hypothetical protein